MSGDDQPRPGFALDWPEAGPEEGRQPAPDEAALRLEWSEKGADVAAPSEPERAEPEPASPPAPTEPPTDAGAPAPPPPASRADQPGNSAFRIRLRSRQGGQLPASTDPHQACRDEIERLEALVADLRGEVKTLRRRAQVRSSSD